MSNLSCDKLQILLKVPDHLVSSWMRFSSEQRGGMKCDERPGRPFARERLAATFCYSDHRNRDLLLLAIKSGIVTAVLAILFVASKRQARRQREADLDTVIEDSFPASDPPSHGTVVSSGGPL